MPPIDDTEGQPAQETGTVPASEAKTTPAGDDAILADLESTLETEEAAPGAINGETEDGQSEDELDEWEDNGKKYKVPKDLKPYLMRDKDYRQKTMATAAELKTAKEMQAKVQEQEKFHRENVVEIAKLVGIDQELAGYRAMTPEKWAELRRVNPAQADYARDRFAMLKDQRDMLAGELQHKAQQKALEAQQDTAKRYEASLARIAKEIPDWNNGKADKLNEYATANGFSLEELEEHVLHPHRISILHKAYLFDQLQQRARAKAKSPEAPQQVQPIPTIGTRRSTSSPLPSDKDDINTWMAKERARVRKAKGAVA